MTPSTQQSLVSQTPGRARFAGVLLVAGMLLFWAGAFSPVPVDYLAPAEQQFAAVADDPTVWLLANILYTAGVLITLAGLIVVAGLFENRRARGIALAAVAVNLLGALVWLAGTYYRITLPGTGQSALPLFAAAMGGWLYGLYAVVTLVSFVLFGVALLDGSAMRRLGAFAVGFSLLELLVYGVTGDIPPFLFYLATVPVGVWLIRQTGRTPGQDHTESPPTASP